MDEDFVCWFVWLFVGSKPEKLYFASGWEGSKPPGRGHTRGETQNCDVYTKDSGTTLRAHVLVNPWLTPKLTGWLASLDLRKLQDASSSTELRPPMPGMACSEVSSFFLLFFPLFHLFRIRN